MRQRKRAPTTLRERERERARATKRAARGIQRTKETYVPEFSRNCTRTGTWISARGTRALDADDNDVPLPATPTNSRVSSPKTTETTEKKCSVRKVDHRGSQSLHRSLFLSFRLTLSRDPFAPVLTLSLSLPRSLSIRTVRDEKRGPCERATIGRNSCW